jgi:hypothetical protein
VPAPNVPDYQKETWDQGFAAGGRCSAIRPSSRRSHRSATRSVVPEFQARLRERIEADQKMLDTLEKAVN